MGASDNTDTVEASNRNGKQVQVAATTPPPYRLLTDANLAALPPLRWRIRGILPESGLAALFGASGSGKTFLALDAAQKIAAGEAWFGHRVNACPVVYVALEGEGGLAGRVSAYRIRNGKSANCIRYLVEPFSLLNQEAIHRLTLAIKAAGGAGVVVIDTLNRAAPGGDENDSKHMGAIIAGCKQIQTLVGGLVLVLHHPGKDASKGPRGHSSLYAALDAAIEVSRNGEHRDWVVVKSKDGTDGISHSFKLDVVELGTDDGGDLPTSCVIRPSESVAKTKQRRRLSAHQNIIWGALNDEFKKAGAVKPTDAPAEVPAGKPCLPLESTIEKIRTRLPVDAGRQKERTRDVVTALIGNGYLGFTDGYLWPA